MALRLDLRPKFRKLGKALQAATAAAIESAGPAGPKKTGSRKGQKRKRGTRKGKGAPAPPKQDRGTAGSLPAELRKRRYLKVRRWGYVLKIDELGQRLTWLVRGTRYQPARPVNFPRPDEAETIAEVEAELARQFEAEWKRQGGRRRA